MAATTNTVAIRVLDRGTCEYLGGALHLAGGRILPMPVTYWRGEGWDLRTFSGDRIAITPAGDIGSDLGRAVSPRMLTELLEALAVEAPCDEDAAETLAALRAVAR